MDQIEKREIDRDFVERVESMSLLIVRTVKSGFLVDKSQAFRAYSVSARQE